LSVLSPAEADELLLAATLEAAEPAWLPDADLLVQQPADLPQDVMTMARALGISDDAALLSIGMAHGKVELENRQRVGSAGELELIALLEAEWPGSTSHIAAEHDGFGYDVAFRNAGETWHLEVKSTTRRGRLVLHLSRHEHEVAIRDAAWRLVAVGLEEGDQLACVATIKYKELAARAPEDRHAGARWETVRYGVAPELLAGGLSFIVDPPGPAGARFLRPAEMTAALTGFAWMPSLQL
jgi:hypothetical protein